MKKRLALLLIPAALLLAACGNKTDCGCADACKCETCDCATKATTPAATPAASTDSKDAAPKKHPLKGVVTDLLTDQSALMVKHEAIPGVMKAMTMLFVVDASVLNTVKKGDAITALMSHTADGDWRLDDVKVTAPATP